MFVASVLHVTWFAAAPDYMPVFFEKMLGQCPADTLPGAGDENGFLRLSHVWLFTNGEDAVFTIVDAASRRMSFLNGEDAVFTIADAASRRMGFLNGEDAVFTIYCFSRISQM